MSLLRFGPPPPDPRSLSDSQVLADDAAQGAPGVLFQVGVIEQGDEDLEALPGVPTRPESVDTAPAHSQQGLWLLYLLDEKAGDRASQATDGADGGDADDVIVGGLVEAAQEAEVCPGCEEAEVGDQ